MKPTNSSNLSDGKCSSIIGTNCVKWSGATLDCLTGFEAGDSLTEIILEIDDKICSIEDAIDITGMDWECITGGTPSPLTFFSAIQALITEFCIVKDSIEALTGVDPDECTDNWEGSIAAPCHTTFWTLTGESPVQSLNTVDEMILYTIQAICALKANEDSLEERIEELEEGGSGVSGTSYTLPPVDSVCGLYPDGSDMDDAIEAIDADLCALKDLVGDYADLDTSLNPGSYDFDDGNGSQDGGGKIEDCLDMTLPVSLTLEDTLTYMWEAISRAANKICELEEALAACCKFSCKDLVIEAVTVLSEDGTAFHTYFVYNGSTSLPSDIEHISDDDSTIRYTSTIYPYSTVYSNFEVDNPDVLAPNYVETLIGGINPSAGPITVMAEISLKHTDPITNVVTNCFKCVTTTFDVSTSCDSCTIVVSQTVQTIPVQVLDLAIAYTLSAGGTGSITITEFGSYVIPFGSTINTISAVGSEAWDNITITSPNCTALDLTITSHD